MRALIVPDRMASTSLHNVTCYKYTGCLRPWHARHVALLLRLLCRSLC
jgi:hypothetical protein